jgi:cysteine desulfuration protein SufE
MTDVPKPLEELVADFAFLDRSERAELLIEYADRFQEVPGRIATRPFPEERHVIRCESDAYAWAEDLRDGTQKFHFAVENPQGLSAKAWATIMDETLSGQPLEQVVAVPCDVVFDVFGRELSMGKGQGLLGMLSMVQGYAQRKLTERRTAEEAEPAPGLR